MIELQSSCKRLLQFLWVAKHGELPSLVITPPENDIETLNWSKFCHEGCLDRDPVHHSSIYSPRTVPQPEIHQIPSQPQIDFQNSLNQLAKLAPVNDKKKGFEKLHPSTQNMILQASSTNGEIRAAAPWKECENFFKSASHSDAKINFLKTMLHTWDCNVYVTSGVIINLFNGNFAREFVEAPSNFSPFSFPKLPFMSGNADKESLSLQLRELSGEGLTSSDICGALAQDFTVPKQIDYMRHNVKNTIGASCIFFSNKSILSQRLAVVAEHIDKTSWCTNQSNTKTSNLWQNSCIVLIPGSRFGSTNAKQPVTERKSMTTSSTFLMT